MISGDISDFLRKRIEAGDFPSAVYLAAEKGEVKLSDALGLAVVDPEKIKARTDTIYDLASLTKVLVTGLLCAKLIERSEITLEDLVGKYLPAFNDREITIRHLVTHTSGLPAWKPIYLEVLNINVQPPATAGGTDKHGQAAPREEIARIVGSMREENPPDTKIVYSDPNFLTLTLLVEKLYSARLDHITRQEISRPLGLTSTFFNPPSELRESIAASETGNEFEKQTCLEMGYDVSKYNWRDYRIWGEVHDGNAWAMNGISGHAGLFSTAYETFRIARQFLPGSTQILKPETCDLFRRNLTPVLNEGRSLGFQLAVTRDSAGSELPGEAFGHLGFTGTSLWIDPIKERIYILLTNRTHHHPPPFQNINAVRRGFHDLAAKILDKSF
jgi:serine-type D-Ala-D-Ala carboxypeptidase